jgi:hypothetical protein
MSGKALSVQSRNCLIGVSSERPSRVIRYSTRGGRTGWTVRDSYLITSTPAFVRAKNAPCKCGNVDVIRKIASLLVHEEWHVRHGDDEAGAYVAQLSTLIALDAGPGHPLYREVTTSMQHAIGRAR